MTYVAADDVVVSLWLGRIGPPKPDDCWELVHMHADGYYSVGACGGLPGEPWVVRQAGVVAGGTGEDAARFVRIGGGSLIPVALGHFLGPGAPDGQTTSVELLDEAQETLAYFSEVPVGGDGG